MRIKYSPCKWNPYAAHNFLVGTLPDTEIVVIDANTLSIDGQVYSFDPASVTWPTIAQDSGGVILEAHREAGILYLTARRFYTHSCGQWDDAQYHEVTP